MYSEQSWQHSCVVSLPWCWPSLMLAFLCGSVVSLPCASLSRWSLAGGVADHTRQEGDTMPTQVATLPGHSHNQLTPIKFQGRGLNLGPLEPVDSKANCYNH